LAYGEVYTMNPVEARKLLIKTYHETGNISETARRWHTSRRVVRKWVGRFQVEGETGLKGRSRRPHRSPRQTPPEVERLVIEARQATNYGRERLALCPEGATGLALYLERLGVHISPYTIRHILRRHGLTKRRKRRNPLYPALWAWEVEEPFSCSSRRM